MSIQDFILQVLASSAVSGAVVGFGVWIFRSWISERLKNAIKNEYDEKLESHKAALKLESALEVEKLKADLAIASAERHLRFSQLHEKRAVVIAETYALLRKLLSRMSEYVKIFEPAGDKPRDERRAEAANAHRDFIEYYAANSIFIPRIANDKLHAINKEITKTYYEFFYQVDTNKNQNRDDADTWLKVFNRMNEEIPTALGELEDEFRQVLGDES